MIRRPPRTTRTDTLFPYTTLFRSVERGRVIILAADHRDDLAVRAHRDQRDLRLAERRAQRGAAGGGLKPRIERGADRLARIADVAELTRLRQRPVGAIGTGGKVPAIAPVDARRAERPGSHGRASCRERGCPSV